MTRLQKVGWSHVVELKLHFDCDETRLQKVGLSHVVESKLHFDCDETRLWRVGWSYVVESKRVMKRSGSSAGCLIVMRLGSALWVGGVWMGWGVAR